MRPGLSPRTTKCQETCRAQCTMCHSVATVGGDMVVLGWAVSYACTAAEQVVLVVPRTTKCQETCRAQHGRCPSGVSAVVAGGGAGVGV
jgi:hypothetical protein